MLTPLQQMTFGYIVTNGELSLNHETFIYTDVLYCCQYVVNVVYCRCVVCEKGLTLFNVQQICAYFFENIRAHISKIYTNGSTINEYLGSRRNCS